MHAFVVCVLVVRLLPVNEATISSEVYQDEIEAANKINTLSSHIIEIMEHYKHPDPVGIPGIPIPDPMPIPDLRHAKSLITLNLKNATIHGLSKFRIDQLYSNVANMQVELALKYATLEVIGNYTMSTFFSSSRGGFNVTIVGVYFEAVVNLQVARDGNLEANDIVMDITFEDITLDFKNLNFLGSAFQGMINTVGTFVFDSIKPFILGEFNTNIRGDINKNLKTVKQTFPNSIPPLDLAIAEGRKYVRENGYDPYHVQDYKYDVGILSLRVVETSFAGLASFYRVGNLTAAIVNNTAVVGFHVSTKKLKGKCTWEVGAGFLSRVGSSSFSVDYLEIETKLNQSLNVRKTPKLELLHINLGNIQLRMNGLGTFDYALEVLVNVLPNVLRSQIVFAVEGLIKQRLEDNLSLIDVEKEIRMHLKDLETMRDSGGSETHLDPPEEFLDEDRFEDISL